MHKLLAGLVGLPLLAFGAFTVFRVLQKDYRYHELVRTGDGLLSQDLAVEASRSYATAIELKPDEPLAYVKRADAEKRQGNLARALADVETAGKLSDDPLLVSSRFADLLYESGRFDEAAGHYERVVALAPDSTQARYQLGLTHFRAGRAAEAIEALNGAAASRPDLWESYYLRGAVFLSIGSSAEAEADFRTALGLSPGTTLPRGALIDLYLDRREPANALPLIEEQIRLRPEDARPYLHLASAHRLSGRTADAIQAVGQALEKNTDLPDAYLQLGELWLEEATTRNDAVAAEKAVAALSNAVKMEPSNGAAALALGRAYLALGDQERGFLELQRASRATPVPADALRLLGDLYRARKNPEEAVTAYHVYLKLNGDSPSVLEGLGDAYVESGNPRLAAEVYLRLEDLFPRGTPALVKAARAYLAHGDRDAAAETCRRGLAADPANQELARILSRLRPSASRGTGPR
jgi:tetratricopeptide (TPR) repeat protein